MNTRSQFQITNRKTIHPQLPATAFDFIYHDFWMIDFLSQVSEMLVTCNLKEQLYNNKLHQIRFFWQIVYRFNVLAMPFNAYLSLPLPLPHSTAWERKQHLQVVTWGLHPGVSSWGFIIWFRLQGVHSWSTQMKSSVGRSYQNGFCHTKDEEKISFSKELQIQYIFASDNIF